MRHPIPAMVSISIALMLAPTSSTAQTVQKCGARNGQVHYQSAPCATSERMLEQWDATPDPVMPPQAARRAPAERRSTHRRTSSGSRSRSLAVAAGHGETCAEAKAYRDGVERRAGLARNFDLLAMLQRRVFDACR